MTTAVGVDLIAAARAALDTVFDPELDEPITDLGFVRSVAVDGDGTLEVHLRLPTSFCSPNFAWIMAGDARDALGRVTDRVRVRLDDHHDSELINAGLANGSDYKQTFGHEADRDLDDLRATFRRKAHAAAMERVVTEMLRGTGMAEADLAGLRLADVPPGQLRDALLRRRESLGIATTGDSPLLVEDDGTPVPRTAAARRVRMARSVRISIDGNAHFCRGLLATRYPGAEDDQSPRPADDSTHRRLLPLLNTERTSA